MAVQPWKLFNKAKKKIGNGTILLNGSHFRMTLHTSASNVAALALSTYASATSEVTSVASSYSSSGKACTSAAWTLGASAKAYKFQVGNVFWSANGAIANIKFAALWVSGASANARHMLAVCSLTASQFTLGVGNRLTVAINSLGVFTAT